MSPEQLAKMQAGRAAAKAAKDAAAEKLAGDEDAQWRATHERWADEHFISHRYVTRIPK